jgi:hypothetical protein
MLECETMGRAILYFKITLLYTIGACSGPQSRSGCGVEELNILCPVEIFRIRRDFEIINHTVATATECLRLSNISWLVSCCYKGTHVVSTYRAIRGVSVRSSEVNWTLWLINWGVCGSGCIDAHFLDIRTSWRSVVSFTPRPLYTRGKKHPVPLGWAP